MPQSNSLHIEIREDQRAAIVGKTGSGKTYLARRMLRPLRRLVVLDPKGTLHKWGLEEWDRGSRKRLADGEDVRVRVALEAGTNPNRFWEAVMQEVYEAADVFVYIDEAYGVVTGPNPGEYLQAIWTRGREFRVGAIAASQRPKRIPLIMLSEADHLFVFRLGLKADRDFMAEFVPEASTGEGEERTVFPDIPVKDKYGFWYYNTEADRPLYIPKLPARAEPGDDDMPELTLETTREDQHG